MAIIRGAPGVAEGSKSDADQTVSFLRACLAGDREAAGRFVSMIIRRGGGVARRPVTKRQRSDRARHQGSHG